MTEMSTLSSFIVVAFCGCWAGLGWTGMHLRRAEIVAGGKEGSKQARTGRGSDGRTRIYGQFWSLGVYLRCLLLKVTSRFPIPHLPSALKTFALYYILLIQSHIFLRRPRFPSRNYYSGSSCTM
jgi:hypothetical protein